MARNKATRPGRDQAAERVRNSESGRCRRGKPTQRSPGFKRRRGPNPKGGVVQSPLRVLHQRSTSVKRWWEAAFDGKARGRTASARRLATPETEGALHRRTRLRPSTNDRELRGSQSDFGRPSHLEEASHLILGSEAVKLAVNCRHSCRHDTSSHPAPPPKRACPQRRRRPSTTLRGRAQGPETQSSESSAQCPCLQRHKTPRTLERDDD